MNRSLIVAVIACCGLYAIGCDKPMELDQQPERTATAGQAKLKLVPGHTTQTDVVRAFGAPNIVMTGSDHAEAWTYDRVAVFRSGVSGSAEVFSGYGMIFPGQPAGWGIGAGAGGSQAKSMSTVRTATLLIEFDQKGVVKKYDMMTTSF